MNRRRFLTAAAMAAAATQCASPPPATAQDAAPEKLDWEGASIAQLRAALEKRPATALTKACLDRVARIDRGGPGINSVIELNPDALAIAGALDKENVAADARGSLHGLPILIKDNIDTADRMMTTAGSNALLGSVAAKDAFIVRKLRAANAVILGKTNLSEWANFRGSKSTSGWSARGGLTKNPHCLDRNPSGSSSGSAAAVAAGLCAAAIGTETDGSIISPAALCGIVGLKPTVGLVSRTGIIPIAASQDTAGPMTRCVADAAILLGAIAGPDPADPATEFARQKSHSDYTTFLEKNGLRKSRLGVVQSYFPPFGPSAPIYEAALNALKDAGATLIPVPELGKIAAVGNAEMERMLFEFKAGINAYLANLDPKIKTRTLEGLIAYNESNREIELRWFGQELFHRAQLKGPLADPAYLEADARCRRFSRAEGIDAVMDELKLDALIAPSGGPAAVTDLLYGNRPTGGSSGPAAIAGYPNITIPAGHVRGLPVGLSFFGRAWSEPTLIRLAYAFEQLVKARRPPTYAPTLG